MLAEIKKALRITATAYDTELMDLAAAGAADLRLAGVVFPGNVKYTVGTSSVTDSSDIRDGLTMQAIKTYVRLHFGTPSDYDRLKASYDEQKAQLMASSGHTEWGGGGCKEQM